MHIQVPVPRDDQDHDRQGPRGREERPPLRATRVRGLIDNIAHGVLYGAIYGYSYVLIHPKS